MRRSGWNGSRRNTRAVFLDPAASRATLRRFGAGGVV
jgi:hypothetical protein